MKLTRLLAAMVFSGLAALVLALPASSLTPAGETTVASDEAITGSAEDFERARFDDPTDIDNKWLPLTPGTQFTYKGSARIEGEGPRRTRRVVSTVTDLTKEIAGVRTLVIWERDFSSGRLIESELAFFAQDNAGNVWLLGEYPQDFEEGKLDTSSTWIAGRQDARAGIAMLAEPRLGTPAYRQGFAPPPVGFRDFGRVFRVGQETCVPVDCYSNVLVIEEFELNAPRAFQLKYHAPGVGIVRVGWRGAKEDERETLELVKLEDLGSAELAEVRQEVIELDRRGHNNSAVYSKTPPVEPL